MSQTIQAVPSVHVVGSGHLGPCRVGESHPGWTRFLEEVGMLDQIFTVIKGWAGGQVTRCAGRGVRPALHWPHAQSSWQYPKGGCHGNKMGNVRRVHVCGGARKEMLSAPHQIQAVWWQAPRQHTPTWP